jgi:NAD dependent epimerase/dehydratase family enzyme
VLGEMADELLLASARIEPAKLLATGYKFRHAELEKALRDLLGKN